MRYILDNEGYIESIAFGSYIECSDKSCTEYTGSIPTGYNSLCEWADNANIRAYYLVDGNLTYDSVKDAELQAKWEEESQCRPEGTVTVIDNLESTSATNALSANQGRVLNEKLDLKNNYMRLKPKETTTIITGDGYSIIPLGTIEEQNAKNNSLIFDSVNNGIKIGAGVHHVEISGEVNWGSVISEGLKATNYVKNGTMIYYTQFVMNTKYTALPGLPLIFAVEEGDLIQLSVYAQADDRLNKAGTRLQVKVID